MVSKQIPTTSNNSFAKRLALPCLLLASSFNGIMAAPAVIQVGATPLTTQAIATGSAGAQLGRPQQWAAVTPSSSSIAEGPYTSLTPIVLVPINEGGHPFGGGQMAPMPVANPVMVSAPVAQYQIISTEPSPMAAIAVSTTSKGGRPAPSTSAREHNVSTLRAFRPQLSTTQVMKPSAKVSSAHRPAVTTRAIQHSKRYFSDHEPLIQNVEFGEPQQQPQQEVIVRVTVHENQVVMTDHEGLRK